MNEFEKIEFPIKVLYTSKKIHKINHPYEFRNKLNKDVYGIVKQATCVFSSECEDCIVYKVELEDGNFVFVDHDSNREL